MIKRLTATLLVLWPLCSHGEPDASRLDVPYVGTPYLVVDHMLEMADVGPGDYLIDLGSGDGRIVIAAAMRGAEGHGVEIDPKRIAEAHANATEQHVRRRVMFLRKDLFEADFSDATVITMYLLPSINIKLRPKLLDKLAPGSRIVSHNFDMDEWHPDDRKSIKVRDRMHNIFLWIVPAKAEGLWQSDIEGARFDIDIRQSFQEVDVSLSGGGNTLWHLDDVTLRGKRISFTASSRDTRYIFNGSVEADRIHGIIQVYGGGGARLAPWHAERVKQ